MTKRVSVNRISIGPGEIAGYFGGLKKGFDEIGIASEHFILESHHFDYDHSGSFMSKKAEWTAGLQRSNTRVLSIMGRCLNLGVRILMLVYAIIRCDVFIFSGFLTFLGFYELPLLRLLKKKIVFVYLGSDARPAYISGRHLDIGDGEFDSRDVKVTTGRKAWQIKRVEKYADVIINHTATTQLFNRPFVRLNALGNPINISSRVTAGFTEQDYNNECTRIVHAPSSPVAKGNPVIKQIIQELKQEGYKINFVELLGVTNREVLEELQQCDFIIDELYSDVPLAMLATEAAFFGKPCVVGGYYAELYKKDNPDIELPPSLYVKPENIKGAIVKLIEDKGYRIQLGKKAQDFINMHWQPHLVAENYYRLLIDDFPKSWECSPLALHNYWGWGLSTENWHKQMYKYVDSMGESALFLDHHPSLKKNILSEVMRSGFNSDSQ